MGQETLAVRVAHDDEIDREAPRLRRLYRRHAEGAIYKRLRADLERSAESGGWFLIENSRGHLCAAGLTFFHPDDEAETAPHLEFGGDLVTARYRGFGLQRALVALRLFAAAMFHPPTHGACFAIVGAGNEASLRSFLAHGFRKIPATRPWLKNAAYTGIALSDFKGRYQLLQASCAMADRAAIEAFRRELSIVRTRADGRSVSLNCAALGPAYVSILNLPPLASPLQRETGAAE